MLLNFLRQILRPGDVLGLRPLIAPSQQHDELLPTLHKIDPVAGAIVDPQFRHAFTHRAYISRIAQGQAADPQVNPGAGVEITQALEPFMKYVCLADFNHNQFVSYKLQNVNKVRVTTILPRGRVKNEKI